MEHKEIYYYNPKYPEHGIGTLPIEFVEWVSNNIEVGTRMHMVGSKINIETAVEDDFMNYYHVYNPYSEDENMFIHDLPGNRERILSFNREKLEEWWREDVKTQYNIMKKRLGDLEECLNQK